MQNTYTKDNIDIHSIQRNIHDTFETEAITVTNPSILQSDILKLIQLLDGEYNLHSEHQVAFIAYLKAGVIIAGANIILLGYIFLKAYKAKPQQNAAANP